MVCFTKDISNNKSCLQLLTASSARVKISFDLLKNSERVNTKSSLDMLQLKCSLVGHASAEHASAEPSFSWTFYT
ncbi:hypothetical protein Tco_0615097 [Tanacetum coccineum]